MVEDLDKLKLVFPCARQNHLLLINKFRTFYGILSSADLLSVLSPGATRYQLDRNLSVVRRRFRKVGIFLLNSSRLGWHINDNDKQSITEWMRAGKRAPQRELQINADLLKVGVTVQREVWDYFNTCARIRDVPLSLLLENIFQCISDDKMVAAILDDNVDDSCVIELPRAS